MFTMPTILVWSSNRLPWIWWGEMNYGRWYHQQRTSEPTIWIRTSSGVQPINHRWPTQGRLEIMNLEIVLWSIRFFFFFFFFFFFLVALFDDKEQDTARTWHGVTPHRSGQHWSCQTWTGLRKRPSVPLKRIFRFFLKKKNEETISWNQSWIV